MKYNRKNQMRMCCIYLLVVLTMLLTSTLVLAAQETALVSTVQSYI